MADRSSVAAPAPFAKLSEIFKGSVPYWMLMLVVMMLIWIFPGIATWLPSLMI